MEVKGIEFHEESGQWCQMLLWNEGQDEEKWLDLEVKKFVVISSGAYPLPV